MNKGSGGDGIPAELFQILKDGAAWAGGFFTTVPPDHILKI